MKRTIGLAAVLSVACLAFPHALASCGSSSPDSAPSSSVEPDAGVDSDPDGGVEADGAGTGDAGVIRAPLQSTYATDGGSIHMACQGSGALPVVFLAGGGDTGAVWANIVAALGPNVLTCTFDRPGVAPSYVPSTPLTPRVVANALAETLSRANIGSRFLLVGHSIGGINLRLFGASYADRIAGAMFLDPTVPSLVTSNASLEKEVAQLGYDSQATEVEGDAVTSWKSDAPIVVLSHDPALFVDAGIFSPADEAIWDEGQDAYARLTSRGTQTDVTNASHYIFVDAPAVVVSAIRNLLQAAH